MSFTFNTCVSGNNIPPVIVNPDNCSSYDMCALDTVSFSAMFLCSEKGQKATLTAYSPGLSGLTADTSSRYSIDSIKIQLIAALADTGTHIITIKATDNGSPPLTDSIEVMVTINPCGDTAKKDTNTGIRNVAGHNNFTVCPNPSKGKFTIQIGNGQRTTDNGMKIEIYNTLGQQIFRQLSIAHYPLAIDLSSQPNNVYFYRIVARDGNLTGDGKLVIIK
jgi:hypothetical protein